MLQGLGFEICSGGIIGMGESKEDVVDMLLELREIRPEALPINFLLPIPGTPLEHADMSALTTAYCMKVLCLARLLVPQSDIRCAEQDVRFILKEKKKICSASLIPYLPQDILPLADRESKIQSRQLKTPDSLMKLSPLNKFNVFAHH